MKELSTQLNNSLHKIMTIDGSQKAFGNFSFKSITINKMKILGNLIYTRKSSNDPMQDAIYKTKSLQRILEDQDLLIEQIKGRLNDAVSPSTSNNITGEKIFAGNVTFKRVTVHELKATTINGINVTDLRQRAWSKSRPQVITGKNVFMSDVKMLGDLQVAGIVNTSVII